MLPVPLVRATMKHVVRRVYGPPFPIWAQRRLGDLLARSQTVPPQVGVKDVVLAGRPARRYATAGAATDAAVLWVHGGAFITGSYATHGSFAAHLAIACGAPVYLLDYRLAPEHRHPAAVDDVVAALELVPEEHVVLGGDSAGGCLSLLAADRSDRPLGLVLVSPLVDLTMASGNAWPGEDVLVRTAWGESGIAAMFGSDLPVLADPGLPAVVHVATEERLRPEGEALAGRIGAELVVVPGWHDIHLQAGLLRPAARAVEQLGASVQRLLSAARRSGTAAGQ